MVLFFDGDGIRTLDLAYIIIVFIN